MSTKTVCDICGSEEVKLKFKSFLIRETVKTYQLGSYWGGSDSIMRDMDICPECVLQINNFINSLKSEEKE